MTQLWKKTFWIDAGERMLKTFIQVFVLQLIASGWFSVDGIQDLDTGKRALLAALGAVLSLLSSLLSTAVGNPTSASLAAPPVPQVEATPDLIEIVEEAKPEEKPADPVVGPRGPDPDNPPRDHVL